MTHEEDLNIGNMKAMEIPKDGLAGLKQNWTADSLSGFLVFLLTLPLSLGIAKASGFPAAMGVLTAMVGGLVVSFFMGGRLTIKGPAAGLITVCAGAVTDFGKLNIEGVTAVQLVCGAIVVMSVIQMIFGFLKLGSYSDFFPLAAVHGMLAAIGILIFAKQLPVLLGVDPALTKGLSPIQLYTNIPNFITHANPAIALVGILSLIIIFGLPALGGFFKRIPAPLLVLLMMIPMAAVLNFKTAHPGSLVVVGDFWSNVKFNVSFAAIDKGVFWKYVFMFLLVSSLESLLTVKALDGLDPWKRKSNYNKDLSALAFGNGVSGAFGGLLMISEVARSSANVGFGGRTRWANFFHGLFLLIAMIILIPVLEMIPSAALAAMLIAVAYRLASPKEFIGTYKIGPEQFAIFIVTIFFSVSEDLLMGVGAGILTKFIFHLIHGAPLGSLFKAKYDFVEGDGIYTIKVKGSAIFSNYLGYKKLWAKLSPGQQIIVNFSEAKLVDHSFMEQLHHFQGDYHATGGSVIVRGLNRFKKFSEHPMAARKLSPDSANKIEIQLSSRQVELQTFAEVYDFNFYPQKVRNAIKYQDFPIQKGNKILYEESILEKYMTIGKVYISDITLSEISMQAKTDTAITVAYISETDLYVPDFALEPEGLWSKLSEVMTGKDIDFKEFPTFSEKYYLRGEDEPAIRQFFSEPLIAFFENQESIHVECHRNKFLIYKKRDVLSPSEIEEMVAFAEAMINAVNKSIEQEA